MPVSWCFASHVILSDFQSGADDTLIVRPSRTAICTNALTKPVNREDDVDLQNGSFRRIDIGAHGRKRHRDGGPTAKKSVQMAQEVWIKMVEENPKYKTIPVQADRCQACVLESSSSWEST